MVVDVLGTAVGIRAPADLTSVLRGLLVDLEVTAPAARALSIEAEAAGTLRLLDGGVEVRTNIAPEVAAATVVWWLNSVAIDEAPQVLVHAACVGDRSAVLFPGASGAGKSTLAAACLADGMSYLSDEYAAVDRTTGMVVPYARPMGLERGLVSATSFGAASQGPLAPGAMVFPRYEPGAAPSHTELDLRATFLGLVAHTANLERLRGDAVPWLAALASAAPGFEVVYSDATDARRLASELSAREVPALRPSILGPVTPTTTTVALGEDTVVYDATTGHVHVLNASAGLIWLDIAGDAVDPATPDTSAHVGAARDALDGTTIDTTLRHLVATGLLPDAAR